MFGAMLLGGIAALLTALPLAWKWGLGVVRVGIVITVCAAISVAVVASVDEAVDLSAIVQAGAVWLMTLAFGLSTLAYRFYRDPERTGPDRDDVIVSPADGRVIYVRGAESGKLPVSDKHGRSYTLEELTKTPLKDESATVIGISLSFLDVHVTRVPISGQVVIHRHAPGRFGSLRRPEMIFENERSTVVIERHELQVAVVQIASRLVRRIVDFVTEGDHVKIAQRLGVIRFGSQVDLVVPVRPDWVITVRPGERVRAGETIVAELSPAASPRAEAEAVTHHPESD
jgi:phosphatidylserine decarboxylase